MAKSEHTAKMQIYLIKIRYSDNEKGQALGILVQQQKGG